MKTRPNVLFIIMDDLAYGDLACHGNPHIRTPHLDRMHARSTRFTQTCSGALCTPARAMIMAGRYAYRTRAIDTYNGRSTLDPDEVTVAQVLKDAGYATCLSGKWHLGDNYPSRPQDLGFDEVLMHNGGGLRQPGNDGYWDRWDSYDNPYLMYNGKGSRHPGYCTDIFTDHAIAFIREQAQRGQPFFTYLATNAPHAPFEVPDEWVQPYREMGLNETIARVYAMVENIDTNVGRVQETLTKLGIVENTLVIYTSDHGPCQSSLYEGESRFNCGLRGVKGSPYAGGLRVPFFWQWLGTIPEGRDVDRVTAPIDVLPTLANLCGGGVPGDRKIDGCDLSPLLLDRQPVEQWPDRTIHIQWHRGDFPRPYVNTMSRNQRYKLAHGRELYDMQNDPGETTDVAMNHPQVVAQLRADYEAWFRDVGTTRPDNYAPPPVHLGTPHESPTVLNRNDRRSHGEDSWIEDQSMGHWVVRFTRKKGTYTVTIDFRATQSPGKVTLAAGGGCWTQEVPSGATSVTFTDVTIPSGDAMLEAWGIDTAGCFAARYVRVS